MPPPRPDTADAPIVLDLPTAPDPNYCIESVRREPLACRHCGARLTERPGSSGRYALTDRLDGGDIYGSGSECLKNEPGHEVCQ